MGILQRGHVVYPAVGAGRSDPPGRVLGDCLGPGRGGKDLHIAQLSAYLSFLCSSCNAMDQKSGDVQLYPLLAVVFLALVS